MVVDRAAPPASLVLDGRTTSSIRLDLEEVNARDALQRPLVDDHVFLVGRPSLRQFVSFVKDLSAEGDGRDGRALAEQWRAGQHEVQRREQTEVGRADAPEILPLPSRLESLQRACENDALYRNAFDTVPTSIAWVALDRLVVYQKHINLAFVNDLVAQLGADRSDEALFRLCLPVERPQPPVRWLRSHANGWVFVSPSNDLRFLGSMALEPNQVQHAPLGRLAAMIGLAVGFGSNFLNAIHAEGRLVLNNGSHRAYALRQLGVTHAPCIVQHASTREELRAIASSDLRRNPDLYLRGPRPSMLVDYFDDALRRVIPCVRRMRQVRLRFNVDDEDVPAV